VGLRNKLKRIVDEGGVAFGATTHIPATALVEILGRTGFDFTMIDTEHGLYDIETAGELIRAAQGANLTPIVRVLKNDKELISKALDLGAQGVVVPHVANKGDAARAVEASKYGPAGRGACPLVRAADYGLAEWSRYQEEANRETMVFLLIEDMEAVRNIEDILSVGGVDVVFPGPFDMSVAAGYQGNVSHPEIQKALDRILAACKERGIPVMHALTGGAGVEAWVNKGVRLILQSADSIIFARACRAFLESVSHLRRRST
jgi:4-hydroxy-2-oxoheptanedioate aldolase